MKRREGGVGADIATITIDTIAIATGTMLGIVPSHNLERAVSNTTTTTHHHHHHLRINNTIMMLPNDRVKRSSLAATSDHPHRLHPTHHHRITTVTNATNNAILHPPPLRLALLAHRAFAVVRGTTRAREAALRGVACPVSTSHNRKRERTIVDRSQRADRARDSLTDSSNIVLGGWKLPKTRMLMPVMEL